MHDLIVNVTRACPRYLFRINHRRGPIIYQESYLNYVYRRSYKPCSSSKSNVTRLCCPFLERDTTESFQVPLHHGSIYSVNGFGLRRLKVKELHLFRMTSITYNKYNFMKQQ